MKKLILALAMIASNEAVLAQSDFSFGQITLKGSGCPQGTYQVIPAPDQKTVSILFDRFSVEVPQYNGQNDNRDVMTGANNEKMDHKTCHIEISANIPVGHKIDFLDTTVDFRGSANMELGTQAQFKSMLVQWRGLKKFDSTPKVIAHEQWRGGVSTEWLASKTLSLPVASQCAINGDRQVSVTLRNLLTATINEGVNPQTTSALVTVDSSDMKGALRFSLRTSSCGMGPTPNPYPNPYPNPNNGICSGRVVTCRAPLVWNQSLCRCVISTNISRR